jgi:ferrochelatase
MSDTREPVTKYDAVVLLGFGGPNGPGEIRPFLDRLLSGRPIPQARYEAVVDHYMQIGGASPYNEWTQRQADGIERALRDRQIQTPVEVAYRNAEPSIPNVLARLSESNAAQIFCIPLAPHQSSASWDKYVMSLERARQEIGASAPRVDYAAPFYDNPLFVQAQSERLRDALARFGQTHGDDVEVIFTAHSIPHATPGCDTYVNQFLRSAELIAHDVGASRWSLAYQSRSGSPKERWLEPDVRDVIRQLPGRGIHKAVVVPIGFLCDHVEVLYDIDIDAKNVAQSSGVRLERATALNDHPLFVQMLAGLAIDAMHRPHTEKAS